MSRGQLVGYIRVSTEEQNTARQEQALADMHLDKTFIDKASGKDTDRPQLTAALAHLREGDTFIIYSMDRLSRSLNDLIGMVKSLTAKGIKVQFIKESLTFTGDNNPMANLMLGIMSASPIPRAKIRWPIKTDSLRPCFKHPFVELALDE
jgi:DNA invertase Pin-like site-specific DNA recombinase